MALYEGMPFYYCEICRTKYYIYTNYKDEFFLPSYKVGEQYMKDNKGNHYPLNDMCPQCNAKMECYQPVEEL